MKSHACPTTLLDLQRSCTETLPDLQTHVQNVCRIFNLAYRTLPDHQACVLYRAIYIPSIPQSTNSSPSTLLPQSDPHHSRTEVWVISASTSSPIPAFVPFSLCPRTCHGDTLLDASFLVRRSPGAGLRHCPIVPLPYYQSVFGNRPRAAWRHSKYSLLDRIPLLHLINASHMGRHSGST